MNPQPSASGSTFLGTFLVVFVLIAALFAVDTFLARIDSAEGHAAAERLFAEGTRLMQSGNPGDAVERFRNALFIAHGNAEYSLALGQALAAAGKPEDAQTVLDELLEREPANGRANLYMARVLAQEAKME